jgi:hypothetical protein
MDIKAAGAAPISHHSSKYHFGFGDQTVTILSTFSFLKFN